MPGLELVDSHDSYHGSYDTPHEQLKTVKWGQVNLTRLEQQQEQALHNYMNDASRDIRDIRQAMPHLTEEIQAWTAQLYHQGRRRTDTKRLSSNKMCANTIIQLIKQQDAIVIKNGREWRRLTFVDCIITPPTIIRNDGQCERAVPLECLEYNKGYSGDVLVFLKEEIYVMQCSDGLYEFDTRQMQQEKRRALIEAEQNGQEDAWQKAKQANAAKSLAREEAAAAEALKAEGLSEAGDQYNGQAGQHGGQAYGGTAGVGPSGLGPNPVQRGQQIDGQHERRGGSAHTSHNAHTTKTYATPVHLLTNAELIERYGQKVSEHIYPYVKLFDLHVLLQSLLDNMTDGLGAEYGECILDDGGCFITDKGVEKILMFRHALVPNIVLVQYTKKGQRSSQYHVECRSEHIGECRSTSTFYWTFVDDKLLHLDETTGRLTNVGQIVGEVSQKLANIPFVIWIRALGVESDDDIRQLMRQVCGLAGTMELEETGQSVGHSGLPMREFVSRVLERCLQEHRGCLTTHDAILKLGSMIAGSTPAEHWHWGRLKLRTEVLPHIGKAAKPEAKFQTQCRQKARFLCYMMYQLLLAKEYGQQSKKRKRAVKGHAKEQATQQQQQQASGQAEGQEAQDDDADEDDDDEDDPEELLADDGEQEDSNEAADSGGAGDEGAGQLMPSNLGKKENIFLTDKDNYFYRVFQSIDELKPPLIQQYLRPFLTKIIPQTALKRLDRNLPLDYYQLMYMPKISKKINFNISMGKWTSKANSKDQQTGVSQNVGRHNYLETLIQHDKIMNPINKEGRQIDPRLLPETAINIVDCVDTPEGESSGLHRQMAQFTHQAIGTSPDPLIWLLLNTMVYALLKPMGYQTFTTNPREVDVNVVDTPVRGYRLVYDYDEPLGKKLLADPRTLFWNVVINQIPIGFTIRPDAVLRQIRQWRRQTQISSETSCGYAVRGDPYDVCLSDLDPYQILEPVDYVDTHGMRATEDGLYGDDDVVHYCDEMDPHSAESNDRSSESNNTLAFDVLCPYKNRHWRAQAKHLQMNRGTLNLDIRTHSARNLRELFVVENLHKLTDLASSGRLKHVTHQQLLSMGIVEYLDVEETRDCLIAADLDDLQDSVDNWSEFVKRQEGVAMSGHSLTEGHANQLYPASKRTNTCTHMENHPSGVYGLCAAMIPLAQCNPPARNSFSSHMMKSAQGKATTISKLLRLDTNYNELWIAERPEVSTLVYDILGLYRLPFSANLNIDIQCADNEEDGGVVNAATIDMGYLSSSNYHTHTIAEKKHKNVSERMGLFGPDQCTAYKAGCDYSKLDERGIIRRGAKVEKNTVLVQKVQGSGVGSGMAGGMAGASNGLGATPCVDCSYVYPGNKFSVVDDVRTFTNDQNLTVVKVRLREVRKTRIGDKLDSDHAQKITTAQLWRRENMQYDATSGKFADVVYSSVSFVSRMTLAMEYEGLLGRVSARHGNFADGTPLTSHWIKALKSVGKAVGLSSSGSGQSSQSGNQATQLGHSYAAGKRPGQGPCDASTLKELKKLEFLDLIAAEMHHNGLAMYSSVSHIDMKTGMRVQHSLIYSGICQMLKLRQMILDKVKARGTGANSSSTKQPQGNKALHGMGDPAQKIGVMESTNLQSYGASGLTYDRMLLSSDPVYRHVCQECKQKAVYMEKLDLTYCMTCAKTSTAHKVLMSGTFDLFTDQLQAANFNVKLHTEQVY